LGCLIPDFYIVGAYGDTPLLGDGSASRQGKIIVGVKEHPYLLYPEKKISDMISFFKEEFGTEKDY
jgi:hypothetical protein